MDLTFLSAVCLGTNCWAFDSAHNLVLLIDGAAPPPPGGVMVLTGLVSLSMRHSAMVLTFLKVAHLGDTLNIVLLLDGATLE